MGELRSDSVRKNTPDQLNYKIDQEIQDNIRYYSSLDKSAIKTRLQDLDKEWDIERLLELNASVLAFTGVVLGAAVNRKWLILSAVVTAFLAQHSIQGWCPPIPLFRKFGIRTQIEIEKEYNALQDILENKEG